jgi:hypothetical protein
MNFDALTRDYLKKLETHIERCDNVSLLLNEVISEILRFPPFFDQKTT